MKPPKIQVGKELTDGPQRSTRIRNLPTLFMCLGVLFALAAIAIPILAGNDLAKENDLQIVSGWIVRAPYITTSHGDRVNLWIRGSDGIHHVYQEDLSGLVPGLINGTLNLRVGDKVIARVQPNGVLGWNRLWEMQRNGTTIVSYQDTHLAVERLNRRYLLSAPWMAGIAFIFLLAAIFLRRRFGAWSARSDVTEAPQGQAC